MLIEPNLFNPDCPLDFWVSQNQGVVGRVLTRHVGLKPDVLMDNLGLILRSQFWKNNN